MFNPLKFFNKFIKSNNDKELSRINNLVLKINSLEKDTSNLPDEEFPKKTNELMAHTYSKLFGLATTGIRFFTVYGPFGRPDMALFKFTKNIISGKKIEVY